MFSFTTFFFLDMCSIYTLSGEPLPSALKISETITISNKLSMVKNVTTFFGIFAQVIADDVVSSIVKSSGTKEKWD